MPRKRKQALLSRGNSENNLLSSKFLNNEVVESNSAAVNNNFQLEALFGDLTDTLAINYSDNFCIGGNSQQRNDPFLGQVSGSPSNDFVSYFSPEKIGPLDFLSPLHLNTDNDDFINSLMQPDIQPETSFSSIGGLNLSSNLNLSFDNITKEEFLDLKYTSTPKCVENNSQKIYVKQEDVSISSNTSSKNLSKDSIRKKLKFSNSPVKAEKKSRIILHDISFNSNFNSENVEGFINILPSSSNNESDLNDLLNLSSEVDFLGGTKITPLEEDIKISSNRLSNVSIIKKESKARYFSNLQTDSGIESFHKTSISKKTEKHNYKGEFVTLSKVASVAEKDKLIYYTGVPDYDLLVKLLSCIVINDAVKLSPIQMLVMTLMKLKHNFEFRDLSYRFNVFESDIFKYFQKTLRLLTFCLKDFVPWLSTIYVSRSPKFIYMYSYNYKNSKNEDKKIFIFIMNSKSPIVHVTQSYKKSEKCTSILNKCAGMLVHGDEVCVKGFSQTVNDPTFFHVLKSSRGRIELKLSTNEFSTYKQNFLDTCGTVINKMRQFKMFRQDISQNPDGDIEKILRVIAILTNLKCMDGILPSSLKTIKSKSSSFV